MEPQHNQERRRGILQPRGWPKDVIADLNALHSIQSPRMSLAEKSLPHIDLLAMATHVYT